MARRSVFALGSRLTVRAALVAFALATFPRPSFGQTASAENIAAARSLGIQGVRLAEEGKCNEAIEKLERAEALYHAPTILGRLGECQVQVGQIVKGTENLNRVVREQLPANAPKAFVDAQARAQKVLDAALPRIAYLIVNIDPPGTEVDVSVGGVPVPAALIGAERPTDPGTHEVVATAKGFLPARATVTLTEGKHDAVTLKLAPDPNAAAPVEATPPVEQPPPAPPPTLPPAQTSASTGGGGKTLGYVLLGVGATGLLVGGVTGALAMGQASDLDDRCNDDDNDNCSQSDIDGAESMALVSTIGFGVGAGAALVGVIVLAASGGKESPAALQRPALRPYVGVGSAGVTGRF